MHGLKTEWLERFRQGLIEIYDRLPTRVLSIVEPVKAIVRQAVAFASELWLPVLDLTIEPGDGSPPLAVLFVGRSAALKSVLSLLAPTRCDLRQEACRPFWKIGRDLKAASATHDLAIVAVNAILYRRLMPLGFWQLPEGVRSVLKLEDTLEGTMKRFQNKTRKAIARFGGDEYSWHQSTEKKALRNFYYHSYVPYAQKKFGKDAVILSYHWVRRLFNTGFLLTVQKAGNPLAAGICRIKEQTFTSELIGIPGGRTEFLAEGASPLLDYYSVDLAVAHRCRYLDFGLSRPFLTNGVVRHKRKWGTTLIGQQKPQRVIGIRFAHFDSARLNLFAGRYPVFIDGHGLVGLVVLETTDRIDLTILQKIEKAYYHRGLTKMILFAPQGFENAACQYAQGHPTHRIVLWTGGETPALRPDRRL